MRALIPALAAGLAAFASTSAMASPGWITECERSHTSNDDPIVFPGQPGAAHQHEFFGSTTTNANSTLQSMLASPTTCGTVKDTAGYWTPTLFRNGVRIEPNDPGLNGRVTRQHFYYRDGHYQTGASVEPFPPDFRMIQGWAHATSIADANAHGAKWGTKMWWGCSDNSVSGKPTTPPNCGNTGILTLHVNFPSCWNGLYPANNGDQVSAGNVKFPSDKVCPQTHPRRLPILIERFEFPVGATTGTITLSSGPTYTAHADFWNTWDQPTLSRLVADCLNADVNCGEDPQ